VWQTIQGLQWRQLAISLLSSGAQDANALALHLADHAEPSITCLLCGKQFFRGDFLVPMLTSLWFLLTTGFQEEHIALHHSPIEIEDEHFARCHDPDRRVAPCADAQASDRVVMENETPAGADQTRPASEMSGEAVNIYGGKKRNRFISLLHHCQSCDMSFTASFTISCSVLGRISSILWLLWTERVSAGGA
jgi:hypothetical protein